MFCGRRPWSFGYREYKLHARKDKVFLRPVTGSGLGLLAAAIIGFIWMNSHVNGLVEEKVKAAEARFAKLPGPAGPTGAATWESVIAGTPKGDMLHSV